MADETNDLVTLVDEEGHEHQFSIVDVVEVDERRYALMVPVGEEKQGAEEEEEEEAYIFRLETDENGEDILVDVDDDEEFERVCAALDDVDDEDGEDGEENESE
ncbi:MAG: DUF1292 domain-containing protein [Patescibacteria group bacterium]